MSFSIDMQALRERASKRTATPATVATVATLLPDEGSKVAALAGLQCTPNHATDADRWCWPHSSAMNTAEIQAFTDRRDRLLRWGYSEQAADDLAERLTLRDREQDDRRACAECRHGRSRRCPDGAPLPGDVLHRCTDFADHAQ